MTSGAQDERSRRSRTVFPQPVDSPKRACCTSILIAVCSVMSALITMQRSPMHIPFIHGKSIAARIKCCLVVCNRSMKLIETHPDRRIGMLRGNSYFIELPEPLLNEVAAHTQLREYQRGD